MPNSLLLLLGFFAVRIISFGIYALLPELQSYIITAISAVIIALFCVLYKKDPKLGLFVLFAELALGGAGHYMEFFGISLRTCLAILYLFLFFAWEKKNSAVSRLPHPLKVAGVFFVGSILLGLLRGYAHDHPFSFIIQDAVPFLYLGLLFPLAVHWKEIKASAFSRTLMAVFISGNALFSLITFSLFSSGIVHLQEPYYKWFRDIAMGKITDMGTGFFRIVLPEHLLVIPIALILTSLLITSEKNVRLRYLQVMSLFIIVANFSRMYLIALAISLFFLFSRKHLKQWTMQSGTVLAVTLCIFLFTHLAASQGQSFGTELFTSRAKSIVDPHSELSSATRMTLLPPIIEKIKSAPFLGSGLGATIPATHPVSGVTSETRQFDWGYLELWTELGAFGLFSFLFFLIYVFFTLYARNTLHNTKKQLHAGMAAGIISFGLITLTSPALLHTFGMLYIALTTAEALSGDKGQLP